MIRHLLRLVWSRRRVNLLLILEISLSVLILFAVANVSLDKLLSYRRPLGFRYQGLHTIILGPRGSLPIEQQRGKVLELAQALREMPQVEALAGIYPSPFEPPRLGIALEHQDRWVKGGAVAATDGLAALLELELAEGRWFQPADDGLSWIPVVINRVMAESLFGSASPVGRQVSRKPDYRVVGVVEDFRLGGELSEVIPLTIRRVSLTRSDSWLPTRFLVRARSGAGAAFEGEAIETLRSVWAPWDYFIEPTAQRRDDRLKDAFLPVATAGIVAVVLMVMVVLGMIGVWGQSVAARTHEIGLRRALGGTRSGIYRQLLVEILLLATLGSLLAVALILQAPLLGYWTWFRGGVSAWALVLAVGGMIGLALLGGLYPARLAARIEPAQALHYE